MIANIYDRPARQEAAEVPTPDIALGMPQSEDDSSRSATENNYGNYSAEQLRAIISQRDAQIAELKSEKEQQAQQLSAFLNLDIKFLMPYQTNNTLYRKGIMTIGDALRLDAENYNQKQQGAFIHDTDFRNLRGRLKELGLRSDKPKELSETSVDDLGISLRALNILQRNGIETAGDLSRLSRSDILGYRNSGVVVADELEKKIADIRAKRSEG